MQLPTFSGINLVLMLLNMQENLPPTDSRLRPDQRYLENGEYEMANSEKLRLEQRQRQVNYTSMLHNWSFFSSMYNTTT